MSTCPYCGNREQSLFLPPKPLVSEASYAVLQRLGLDIPSIQMCKRCNATLAPSAFVAGTPQYAEAYARVHSA